ncbi:hypothetical protein FHR47_001538 [Xanthomonas arboricola]|uniref:hypothetical protein n=1 Tax=Xanthomonas cannabis TaxID=1885674 RepID=UPI0016224072|nr:hypothetical protein [Xanthomonas cannabis]MBB3801304.1 hypothetical protein [Xanthomonas cannabis]
MRTELAYSEEFNDIINAERAYELYWADIITDKRAFCCPGEACPARYTCANLDTPELELKQQPHYRVQRGYDTHTAGCPFEGDVEKIVGSGVGKGRQADAGSPAPDRFLMSRPADHFKAKTAISGGTGGLRGHGVGGGSGGLRSRRTDFYSVAALVSRWTKARTAGVDADQTIRVGANQAITYKEMFECIFSKRPQLTGKDRVYWGTASIAEEEKGFRIKFRDAIESVLPGTKLPRKVRPSLMIWRSDLQASEMKKLHAKRLMRFASSGEPCVVFLYGVPLVTKGKDESGLYVGFKVKNLDLIDVESMDIYERIKRPPAK